MFSTILIAAVTYVCGMLFPFKPLQTKINQFKDWLKTL